MFGHGEHVYRLIGRGYLRNEVEQIFILGGLFVMETLSDVIQVGYFKMTHKRVFKMAPIHHHFELKGWPEVKVVIRFWMIELLFVLVALVLFYGDWVARSGL